MPPQMPEGLIPADLDLVGLDGNAFAILGAVAGALREAGNSPEIVTAWHEVATAGDYSWLLASAVGATV